MITTQNIAGEVVYQQISIPASSGMAAAISSLLDQLTANQLARLVEIEIREAGAEFKAAGSAAAFAGNHVATFGTGEVLKESAVRYAFNSIYLRASADSATTAIAVCRLAAAVIG